MYIFECFSYEPDSELEVNVAWGPQASVFINGPNHKIKLFLKTLKYVLKLKQMSCPINVNRAIQVKKVKHVHKCWQDQGPGYYSVCIRMEELALNY